MQKVTVKSKAALFKNKLKSKVNSKIDKIKTKGGKRAISKITHE